LRYCKNKYSYPYNISVIDVCTHLCLTIFWIIHARRLSSIHYPGCSVLGSSRNSSSYEPVQQVR
jgi:hypothetical protein